MSENSLNIYSKRDENETSDSQKFLAWIFEWNILIFTWKLHFAFDDSPVLKDKMLFVWTGKKGNVLQINVEKEKFSWKICRETFLLKIFCH